MKVLETRIVPLASALTLNPSPKKGEGLQSGTPLLPKWEKGLGDVELALPEGWASHLTSVRTIEVAGCNSINGGFGGGGGETLC